MSKITKVLDFIIYWSIIFLPLSIAIANGPMNVFAGFLIVGFLAKKLLKKERIFTKTPINLPLLLLFLITCLSIFNSIDYSDSLKGGAFKLLRYVLILFILVSELRDRSHIKKVVFSIGVGLALASIDGIWQVVTGYDFIRGYAPVINLGIVRATASFKDSNVLGIYLSAFSPILFGLSLYYFKGTKRILLGFLSSLVFIGIILTYSRPTLLAIYLALFILAVVRKNKLLISLLVIVTILSPILVPKSVKEWVREVDYNPLRFMCNDDRIAIYRNSLNMIREHPVIGVGANTFMKNYRAYKESPEYRNVITSDFVYAHNNFLHMAAEIGLFGLGVFIWLLHRLFRICFAIYKRFNDDFIKVISLSLLTCITAFLVNGLAESSLYYSRVAVIFWFLVGFSLALNKLNADKP